MADELNIAAVSAAAGLKAQSTRLRVVSENMANANATSESPGGDPYVRKTITFASELDRASGASLVKINRIGRDKTPFQTSYDPGHPAADATGYVKVSNVNTLVEMSDMREAHRSYEANLQTVRQVREMMSELIDLLRGK